MTKPINDYCRSWTMRVAIGLMIFVALQIAGCNGVGPPTVVRDRFDYVTA